MKLKGAARAADERAAERAAALLPAEDIAAAQAKTDMMA